MQFKLTFSTQNNLSLPLGHHAALQGFIYHILSSNPDYADFLHDTGYNDGPHSYKLFVFSTLRGKHTVSNGRIYYNDRIYLDVRSPKSDFCDILTKSLQSSDEWELFHQPITLEEYSFSNKKIKENTVNIRMLSPLTLSTTVYENEKKRTRYISPLDEDFESSLNHNTSRKYLAAYDKEPRSTVSLTPISLKESDKYITKFNNHIYINAWNGSYTLSGDPDILSFLYDAGIGSRNSQGFGMFDVF